MTADGDALLTAPKVAVLLGVSAETVRRWADDGRLEFVELPSGQRRFRQSAIDKILAPSDRSAS